MKKWKKYLSIGLASAMALSLCACGGGNGGNKGGKGEKADPSLAKQGVYRLNEYDLSAISDGQQDAYVQDSFRSGDKIYTILQGYSYDETTGDSGYNYNLIVSNTTDNNIEILPLQQSLEGAETAEDQQADQTPPADNSASRDGSGQADTLIDAGQEVVIDGDTPADDSLYPSTYENTNFSNFRIAGDLIYGTKDYYFEDYSDPDNYISEQHSYLCQWDLSGTMTQEILMENGEEDSNSSISALIPASDGSVHILFRNWNDSTMEVMVMSPDGTFSGKKSAGKLNDLSNQLDSLLVAPDGSIIVLYYDSSWSKEYATTYDLESDTLSEEIELPTMVSNAGRKVAAEKDLLVYSDNQGVYKYRLGDTEATQIMNFINSDCEFTYLNSVVLVDDDHFVGYYTEYDDVHYNSVVKGGLFAKVAPEDIQDKETLVIGGTYFDNDLRKRAIAFNKSSDSYRLVLKDYSQYNSYDDYTAAYTQLNNDIVSGSMPDILVVDNFNMSLENYVSKGLLADVGALLEKDEELSGKEYLQNVFEACKIDGKLYEVVPSFYIVTYIGKASLIGDRTSWTMAEAQEVLKQLPEGASMFGETTRDSFMRTVLEMCGSDFIDISTGKCAFDSDEFIAYAEFAKTLPAEYSNDDYDDNWYQLYQSQYRENRTLLMSCYLSSMTDMVNTINGAFGEEVAYVGFPGGGSQGSVIYTGTTYALSAKSAHLDAAWDFVKYYLTDEYQETLSEKWSLPVSKECLDEAADKATKNPVYTTYDGKEEEGQYSYWINDEEIILDPLTTEQRDKLVDFVSSVNTRAYNNDEVFNIISEEMGAFYQGQKSAKECASVIQSRVQIYVNENR